VALRRSPAKAWERAWFGASELQPVGFRKWPITAIVLIARKYFLGGAHSISQACTRHQLTTRRQIRDAHVKTYATKEFFVFRRALQSDIYIESRSVLLTHNRLGPGA
jgi:hypothetical protein